jgi:hypothetical protein
MNKATFYGRLVGVEPIQKFTKDGIDYEYQTVVFHLADPENGYHAVPGNFIAANMWDHMDIPEPGTLTKFTVRLVSERNKKNPEIFFHKVNLQKVEVV